MNEMKILLVQDTDWIERGPHQQHHLLERLVLKGHDIRVIDHELLWREKKGNVYTRRSLLFSTGKIDKNITITVIRPSFVRLPILAEISMLISYRKEIEKQIKEFKPNLVASGEILSTYLALKAAKRHQIPFVYFEIDETYRCIPFKLYQPLGKLFEEYILRNSDRVLVINDKLRDYAMKMGAHPDKIFLSTAGVDHALYNQNANMHDIRERYGIKEDDRVLFFMGWLYQFSGLKEVAIELSKNKNEKSKVKLLIVGEGDAFDDLQKIKERYDMQDRIILTDKQPYELIPKFLACADICLLPADPKEKIMQEIVPIKMYEYMAMGKPVVATKLPGVMKEFGEDHGVIYVDKSEDVAKKSIELIENNSYKSYGLKSRKFVEKYDWGHITDEFEKNLEELI